MTQRNRRRQRRRGGVGGKLPVRRRRRPRRWSRSPRSASPPGCSTSPPTRPRSPPASRSTRAATRPSTPADGSKLGRDRLRRSARRRSRSSASRKQLQLATVAIEDQRFYEHGGVDPEGDPARRARRTSKPAKTVEGGSTITQQLVRNLCIPNPERNLERKIVEAKLAIEYAEAPLAAGNPRPVPQHRLLRDGRGRDRGRRPGRLADLLLASRSGS